MNSNDISMMIYLICVLVTLLVILFLFFQSVCGWYFMNLILTTRCNVLIFLFLNEYIYEHI